MPFVTAVVPPLLVATRGDGLPAVGPHPVPRHVLDVPRVPRAVRRDGGAVPRRDGPATAVYVIKTSTRAAFDAAEVIRVGARFAAVDADAIRKLRRDWRRTTMEAMHEKLRVTELCEAQQRVGTFGVEQARSLLLALRLEGTPAEHEVGEAEVGELERVLPGEEAAVVATFLRSTAAVPTSSLPTPDPPVTAARRLTPSTRETAAPGGAFRAAEVRGVGGALRRGGGGQAAHLL